MKRVTLRVPKQQVDQVDRLVERGEYPNRSEAIRASIRSLVNGDRENGDRRRYR